MDKKNLLLVDIGNTTTTIAVSKLGKIDCKVSVPTGGCLSVFKKTFLLQVSKLRRKYKKFDACVVCSVVPKRSSTVILVIKKELNLQPLLIGKDVKVPIKNCYRNPSQVGQDRLVCAYGAYQTYQRPVIVIDLGTAITIDVVSDKGEYKGGIIVPGINLSAQSLFRNTALLPEAQIALPKSLIGRTTKESILSGIFYGYSALLDGLILKVSRQFLKKPYIVLTGGHAKLMKKFLRKKIDVIDDMLVFKSMALLFQPKK